MADDAARDAARGAGGAAAPAGAGVNGRRSRGSVASADSVVLLVAMLLLALPQLEAAWAPLPIEEPLHVQPGYGSAMGADVGAQALVPFSATSSGALYLLASEGGATSLHSLVWFPPTGSALFEYSNYQAAVTGGLQNKEDWVSLVVNAATAGATNNICINSKRLAGTAVCGPGYSPNQYEVPMEVDVAESPADLSNESAVCVRGQVSCRTRSVPSEVGVRGVSPRRSRAGPQRAGQERSRRRPPSPQRAGWAARRASRRPSAQSRLCTLEPNLSARLAGA